MTHDELLAKIVEKEPGTLTYSNGEIFHSTRRLISWQLALRAIVGLHKPTSPKQIGTGYVGDRDMCSQCKSYYPCPSIQTIEKELG